MRRPFAAVVVGLGALTVPAVARADSLTRVLDFSSRTSVVGRTYATVHGLAVSFLLVAIIAGLLVEWLRSSPTRQGDIPGFLRRALIITFLLWQYPTVFGAIVGMSQHIADRVAPNDATMAFGKQAKAELKRSWEAAYGPGSKAGVMDKVSTALGMGSGFVVESLVATTIFLAEALSYAFGLFARVVLALLYCLGPLMLVAGIPRSSGTAGRWFSHLMSVASWPIISGLLLSIAYDAGLQGFLGATAIWAHLAAAMVMASCVLITPSLASRLVGGGLGNIAGEALPAAARMGRQVANPIGGIVSRFRG